MKRFKTIIICLILSLILVSSSGCLAVAAGVVVGAIVGGSMNNANTNRNNADTSRYNAEAARLKYEREKGY